MTELTSKGYLNHWNWTKRNVIFLLEFVYTPMFQYRHYSLHALLLLLLLLLLAVRNIELKKKIWQYSVLENLTWIINLPTKFINIQVIQRRIYRSNNFYWKYFFSSFNLCNFRETNIVKSHTNHSVNCFSVFFFCIAKNVLKSCTIFV